MSSRGARYNFAGPVLLSLVLVAFAAGQVTAQTSLPLIGSGDLTYAGAFRIADEFQTSYGGTALAVNPSTHTLFLVGHAQYQLTAEFSIPSPIIAQNITDLNVAKKVQGYADATSGLIGTYNTTTRVGGQLVYKDRLIGSVFVYYDAELIQKTSHWQRPGTSLSTGTASGLYQIGDNIAVGTQGYVSGFMTTIPSEWQAALGGPVGVGQCCISIDGRTSHGPSLTAFDPSGAGASTTVSAAPLLYYPPSYSTLGNADSTWNGTTVLWNGMTWIRGVVFPEGTRSVLFFGTQGTGPYCYGPGTSDPTLAGQPDGAGNVWCYDPLGSSKGTHGYPYVDMVWAYDANDLLAVKNGTKKPWDVRPYATWAMSLPFGWGGGTWIGGAAWDPGTRRLYISKLNTDIVGCCDANPVIHVFDLGQGGKGAGDGTLLSPSNLSVH